MDSARIGAEMHIPLSSPDITNPEREAVLNVLFSPNLSLGPQLDAFEKAIASFAGSRFAVAVNSGTSALHLAIKAARIEPDDEVVTTPFSFIASANCILFERGIPVFVDIDPATLNIDASKIEAAITPRTRAILPVHVFGRPCRMDRIRQIADKHGLAVIEDSCEAIGATFQGKRAGSLGHFGTFAFYPNKQITTGEGGILVTDDEQAAKMCRSWRNQGRDESRDWLQHRRLGYNYRLSDINCALGLVQLERLAEMIAQRADVASKYNEALSGIDEIIRPTLTEPEAEISWFVYVVRLATGYSRSERDQVLEFLRARGVGCSNYFTPIHLQPFYRESFGFQAGQFPHTEKASERTLALPFFNRMTEDQIAYVAETLRAAVKSIRPKQAVAVRPQIPDASLTRLLGREPVTLDEHLIRKSIENSVVLVTGAAGSIGSELCRHIARFGPRMLIILDQAESALAGIDRELRGKHPDLQLIPVICDIRNRAALNDVFCRYPVESLFHAAAYKHVTLMESQLIEAVANNVVATWHLADIAQRARVRRFLMISSDKAVNPRSVMGATKRAAELIVASMAQANSGTQFVSVRFGNVLGSNGSVVPIFQSQIACGGPLTVTDPEARRYFMFISEAVQLVLQASTIGKGSEIFVLEMGEPIRIVDLARTMIKQAGFVPDMDIEIRFIGLRPGEKLFEELCTKDEAIEPTRHEKIKIVRGHTPDTLEMSTWIRYAEDRIRDRDSQALLKHLRELVPEYVVSWEHQARTQAVTA